MKLYQELEAPINNQFHNMHFGSAPFAASLVPPSSSESAKLIAAIRDQTSGIPPHFVYVIDIVSVKFGGYFTAEVRAEL